MSFKTDLREIITKAFTEGMEFQRDYGHDTKSPDLTKTEAVDSIIELVEGLVGEEETEELNDFDWRKTRNEFRAELKEKMQK